MPLMLWMVRSCSRSERWTLRRLHSVAREQFVMLNESRRSGNAVEG